MKHVISVSALLAPLLAFGACPTPERWAEAFYKDHYFFYVGAPASSLLPLVTAQFGDLLKKEAAYAGGEVGHLDYDPWLGAQDGEIGEPLVFHPASAMGHETVVSMTYSFGLGEATSLATHTVRLVVHNDGHCWRLHDLITPAGDSLSDLFAQP